MLAVICRIIPKSQQILSGSVRHVVVQLVPVSAGMENAGIMLRFSIDLYSSLTDQTSRNRAIGVPPQCK